MQYLAHMNDAFQPLSVSGRKRRSNWPKPNRKEKAMWETCNIIIVGKHFTIETWHKGHPEVILTHKCAPTARTALWIAIDDCHDCVIGDITVNGKALSHGAAYAKIKASIWHESLGYKLPRFREMLGL